jgi:7-keto-8-aminopelargonate synthetase-like enzyme
VTEGLESRIDLIVGTLSKSFGVFGGFAAASEILVERMINFSRSFLFATAPPPHLAAAALEALRLIREERPLRERLWQNVDRVKAFLLGKGFEMENRSPIFPLPAGEEKEAIRLSEALFERGILIPAIRYPAVAKGKARLRLTVSAVHTEDDLETLFKALGELLP